MVKRDLRAFFSRDWAPGGARAQLTVIIVGLIATILATAYAGRAEEERRRAAIERLADRIAPRVLSEFEAHFALIRGAAGFISASETVDAEDFSRFADILDIDTRYGSTQGLGYARRIDGRLDEGTARTRIAMLEPRDERNEAAIGFDMWSEPTRRAAMRRAAETGDLAASGVVTLRQEMSGPQQPGFLVYFPVYRDGASPQSADSRLASLVGWTYMPFRAGDFFDAVLSGTEFVHFTDFVIRAGDDPAADVLFATRPSIEPVSVRKLAVAGQEWRVEVAPNDTFLRENARLEHWLIPIGGLLATALLAGAVAAQGRALARAQAAEGQALQGRERTELLMREMNHRVANSLQIAGAMVVLQARQLADPAAKEALTMTRDRIAAIAQVHRRLYTSHDVREVELTPFLAGLVDELKRTAGADVSLSFEGEEGAVSPDRAVSIGVAAAELVGNALKYGRAASGALVIRMTLRRVDDDVFELVVEDQGPGHSGVQGTGLGHTIVTSMAASLNGSFSTENLSPGFRAALRFPVAGEITPEEA